MLLVFINFLYASVELVSLKIISDVSTENDGLYLRNIYLERGCFSNDGAVNLCLEL